jgi:two-component system sensor histidine kinase KdpD
MTNTGDRLNPDELLQAIHLDEEKKQSSKLRIFLGMSPGVGKTYSMLKAAQAQLKDGVDVVIGVVETHGRRETAELVQSLPQISLRELNYKNVKLQEMDIDAILKRRPQLVLVDELAHSNIPESRHPKRYQDVLELLDAGIDVFTTINVQHLESRKDLVEKITGVSIRETVPDTILERASQIELIDITPLELLKRLREGKVYIGDKAVRAMDGFFKEDRLTALREIALRVTAERVDYDLQQFHDIKKVAGPWATNERLMVAVSHSPTSENVIRATRRIAYSLEAPWIAVHVDTGRVLSTEDQAQLSKNINLARELGAEVITTTDTNQASALRRVALQKNVSQILIGRPARRGFRRLLEGSFVHRLIRDAGDVNIHILREENKDEKEKPILEQLTFSSSPMAYWNTSWFIFAISFLSGLLFPFIGYRAVGFIFLLGVLIVGMFASIGPTLFTAVVSAFVWNFFFIPPRMTFVIREPEDVILCLSYLCVALILGYLTNRIRTHERVLREREDRTNALYEISQDIATSRDKNEFLTKINERIGRLLNGECGIILRSSAGLFLIEARREYSPELSEKEKAVAIWAFNSKKAAGWSTDTLSEAGALYIPLNTSGETLGVLVYQPLSNRKLSLDQENLLYSIAGQLSLALEKHFFEKRLRESEKLEQSEKLHQTLLNSISHELRTPLTTIMGTATALEEEANARQPEYVKTLAGQLLEASDRLNRVVENLLDMSRLNSGVLSLNMEWQDLNDLVNVTLKKIEKNLRHHKIHVELVDTLPLLEIDFRLMEHALANLILNAVNYTPSGTDIYIRAAQKDMRVELVVEDAGHGISEEYSQKIFDKFFRVPGTPAGGTGLGLSIVKSIVEAHKGSLRLERGAAGGARFVIDLPFKKSPPIPEELDE